MIIEVEDLQIGDEIIISNFSELKYLKVLKTPTKSKQKHWKTGITLYSNVKCSEFKTQNKMNQFTENLYSKFNSNITEHNSVIYKDLNGRDIWLVKKEK